MKRIFTNNQIYDFALDIIENPIKEDTYIPVKLNFYIQKNIQTVISEYKRIEQHRADIIKYYGEPDEKGQVTISRDKIQEANRELQELGDIKQEIELNMLSLEDLAQLKLSTGELKSIMFMIEEK